MSLFRELQLLAGMPMTPTLRVCVLCVCVWGGMPEQLYLCNVSDSECAAGNAHSRAVADFLRGRPGG
jgi:hypothetical protein